MDQENDYGEDYENTESDYVPHFQMQNTDLHTSNDPQQDGRNRRSRTSSRTVKRSFRSSKITTDDLNRTSLHVRTSVESFNDEDYECEDFLDLDETLVQLEHTLRLSFLDKFAGLPNIDEISSESTETIIEQVEANTVDMTLSGKFVDPLTGLDISESDKEDEYDFVEIEESYEEEDDGYELFDNTEDSELLQLLGHDVSEETEEGDNALLDLDYIQKIMQAVDLQDIEQLIVDDTRRQCEDIVAAFIEDLFQIVNKATQYKDPQEILRKSVDKRKLMDEINEKVRTLEKEQGVRMYLNRKVVDHHKRKHMYRAITEDSAENLEFLMAKYQSLLQKYNEVLGKEEEIEHVTKIKIDKLHEGLDEKQCQVDEKLSEFEALAYRVILQKTRRDMDEGDIDLSLFDNSENAERFRIISIFLKKMALARKELSKSRLILIKKQHLFTELQKRLNKIQNIGNGLKLFQFENLQNDVIQLFKKNDERDSELAKARTQQLFDVHISTHLRERILMLRNRLSVQKLTFRELLRQSQITRRNLYKQKQIRAQIRKEIKDYTFQGGILSKPSLMLDYDQTVEEIDQKRVAVEALRSQYKKIVDKIAYYEQMLNTKSSNKYVLEK
ncbi:cilia- and flagella-associated protein 184 [Bactrocera oleae]|uniref:cilia- and flagella-associated protein 184 n=1 Tax=Bactrocera oleae TaxID=104688 RepID=UPI00387EC47F